MLVVTGLLIAGAAAAQVTYGSSTRRRRRYAATACNSLARCRYKAVFKVYPPVSTSARRPRPRRKRWPCRSKRIQISMLRDIDSSELCKLFSRGIEDNMDKAAFSELIPGVLRMSQVFSDHKKLVAGDEFMIDWVPGTGT